MLVVNSLGLESEAFQSTMRSPTPTPPPVFVQSNAGSICSTFDASMDMSLNDALMLLALQQQAADATTTVLFPEEAGPVLPDVALANSEQDIDQEIHYLLALKQQLRQQQQQRVQEQCLQQQKRDQLAAAGMTELLTVERSGASNSR